MLAIDTKKAVTCHIKFSSWTKRDSSNLKPIKRIQNFLLIVLKMAHNSGTDSWNKKRQSNWTTLWQCIKHLHIQRQRHI